MGWLEWLSQKVTDFVGSSPGALAAFTAVHKASPELINVEKRSETEVRELHDRYEEVQAQGPGERPIADGKSRTP